MLKPSIAGISPLVKEFRQSKEKPSLYVGFQVMSAFLEMRRLILLQKMAFLSLLLHCTELLPCATKLISEKWQKSWNNCTGNKLQSINPTIGVYQHFSCEWEPCGIRKGIEPKSLLCSRSPPVSLQEIFLALDFKIVWDIKNRIIWDPS